MNEAKLAEVQRWPIKSQHDVGSAEGLVGSWPRLKSFCGAQASIELIIMRIAGMREKKN